MTSDVEIWNLLNKVKISDVTQSQLNEMTSRVAVDEDAIKFWSGVITVARAIGESRTFAHGLPIYDTGTVLISTIPDAGNTTVGPSSGSTEIWLVQNLSLDNCVAAFKDSDGNLAMISQANINSLFPFYLTSSMQLLLSNASGSEQTPSISYLKVSL